MGWKRHSWARMSTAWCMMSLPKRAMPRCCRRPAATDVDVSDRPRQKSGACKTGRFHQHRDLHHFIVSKGFRKDGAEGGQRVSEYWQGLARLCADAVRKPFRAALSCCVKIRIVFLSSSAFSAGTHAALRCCRCCRRRGNRPAARSSCSQRRSVSRSQVHGATISLKTGTSSAKAVSKSISPTSTKISRAEARARNASRGSTMRMVRPPLLRTPRR